MFRKLPLKKISKKNITKCQQAFNQYFNYNFDLYFNFLKNECDYSNYIFNNLEISNNGLLDAIKRFNNNDNNKNIENINKNIIYNK